MSVGLAGAAAPIRQAHAETAPSTEAGELEQPADEPSAPHSTSPRANGERRDRRKHHLHHWKKALRRRLHAHKAWLRKRIKELSSRSALGLAEVHGALPGKVNDPARSAQTSTDTSGAPESLAPDALEPTDTATRASGPSEE